MAYQIELRRDTATNWTSINPTLGDGEPGYEKDTGKLKIGDGVTPWATLPYFGGSAGSGGGGTSGALIASDVPTLNSIAQATGVADGQIGIIRLGTGIDRQNVVLIWNNSRQKWVSKEFGLLRATDQSGTLAAPSFKKQIIGLNIFTGDPVPANQVTWSTSSFRKVNQAYAAGLTIEYRQHAFMAGDTAAGGASPTPINVGAIFFNVSSGDARPNVFQQGAALGGWAETHYMKSAPQNSQVTGYTSTGWQWEEQGWTALPGPQDTDAPTVITTPPAAPTKSSAIPMLFANVDAGGNGTNSSVIDYGLFVRYVG